jgi:hypothetical protein
MIDQDGASAEGGTLRILWQPSSLVAYQCAHSIAQDAKAHVTKTHMISLETWGVAWVA